MPWGLYQTSIFTSLDYCFGCVLQNFTSCINESGVMLSSTELPDAPVYQRTYQDNLYSIVLLGWIFSSQLFFVLWRVRKGILLAKLTIYRVSKGINFSISYTLNDVTWDVPRTCHTTYWVCFLFGPTCNVFRSWFRPLGAESVIKIFVPPSANYQLNFIVYIKLVDNCIFGF